MPYIDVTVNVDLDDFDDQALIDEIESRGWIVSEEKGMEFPNFSNDDLDYITSLVENSKPGTQGYEIHLKVRKGAK